MKKVLLVSSAPTGIADALRADLDLSVNIAATRRAALTALRQEDFALILMDESLTASDPEGTDLIFEHARAAPLLELNFAITSAPRVVRQVRAALARRAYDQAAARAAAATSLENELSASLAGLLLESQLALRQASPAQAPKLQYLVELAGDLRTRLRG